MCVHGHAARSSPAPRVSSVSSVAIHPSRHLRGLTTWCYLPHRGSRGRRRAEVRGRRWTKLRGARGTVEYVRATLYPHTHPYRTSLHVMLAYTGCHRRCVCGRGPVLGRASAHRSVRGTGRDHIPVWPCVSLRQRPSPLHRKCRAAEILEAAPTPRHARFQRLQVWCLCFGTVTLGFPAVFCCGDCCGSCCGNCCRCNICDDVC